MSHTCTFCSVTGYENLDLEGKSHEIMLLDVNTMEEFENSHFEIVKDLCNDLAIATTFSEEKERLVEYNLDYFLRHIDRIFEPNYIPNQEDILHLPKELLNLSWIETK